MATGEATLNGSAQAAEAAGQYSTFYVEDLFFGVDVLQVQEVLLYQEMTRIPLAADVDMRRRLRLKPRAEGENPMNMVVRTEGGAVSLLVDQIGDVLEVETETFEPPPDNVDPAVRELIRGVHKLEGRLLLVLDLDKTVDIAADSKSPA